MNNHYTNKSPHTLKPDVLKTVFETAKSSLKPRDKSVRMFQSTLAILTVIVFGALTSVCSAQTQTFTASGTFTVPAGVTSITVQAWGGGGGGGLASSSANGKGGGGGGAYASSTLSVTGGSTYTVTVGAGGIGGTSSVNATSGGNSSFAALVVALGGTNASNTTSSGAGGAGGLASGSTGTIKFNGGNGGTGNTASGGGGGGGGSSATSAGVGVNGGNASSGTGGAGGNGADGDGGAGGNNNNSGVDGTAPGGGGGGRGDVGSSSGDGGTGQVRVTWTCPTYALTAPASATTTACGSSTSTVTLNSSSLPSGTYTVTYNLTGAHIATGSTATMTFSAGTGTFSTSSLTVGGTTTITVTNLASAGCSNSVSSNNTASVVKTPAPTAVAGTAITTCSTSGAVNITAGSSATNNAGITWTSNGTGTFTNPNSLTLCTYTPSAADITAGSRTLTLTATGNGTCANAVSTKTITINQAPTSNAGTPIVSCYSSGAISITAGSSAANQASVTWTSSGTGTFANATSLTTATYTPSTADKTAGSVTLTLTANPLTGCTSATSSKALTITLAPTAVAGTAIATCSTSGAVNITAGSSATNNAGITWTSNGTGTFTNPNSLTLCTYTPSAADITAGSRTLTLTATGNGTCANAVSTKTITINQAPTSNAGTPIVSCYSSGAISITAGSSAANQASVTWTSSGTGTFANATSLTTATYTPSTADKTAGSVTLTLTANPLTGCTSATSSKALTITLAPTAVAGTAIATCSTSGAVNITAGSSATNNAGIEWTCNGTGTFTNPNSLTLCTYTPSAADITAGSRTLTLTATGNGTCANAVSTKTITINQAPTSNAGTPIVSCYSSGAISITAGSSAANQASVTWTSSGTGTFANATSLTTATYTPSTADKTAGSVTLTLTANPLTGCTSATSSKALTITLAPTAVAGTAIATCSTSGAVNITAGSSATNNAGIEWTCNGTGTFTNPNSLTLCTYTPSAADITAGSRTLTLTATGNGTCANAVSTKTITINKPPIAVAGNPVSTCSYTGAVNITSGASATNQASITWTSSGTGSFANATSLTTCTYTPSAADIAAGSVTLTLAANALASCTSTTSTKTLTITTPPAAPGNITGSISVCSGAGLTYSITPVSGATSYTWTVPTGWSIASGQGTNSIAVVSGSNGQNGNVTVIASNSCGNTNPTSNVNINPVISTNNTGYTTSSAKTDGNITCASSSASPERRGYVKFPLGSLPAGAVITASTLSITNNSSGALSGVDNDVVSLGNNDPVSTAASTLYNAIGSGASYNNSTWNNTGTIAFPLSSTANSDIQARITSPGYIAMGLMRGGGTSIYNFFGYSGGASAPKLAVTYASPKALAVTVNGTTAATVSAGANQSICPGETAIMAGSFGGGATSATWSTSGTGSFDNDNADVVYTPSGDDITAGSVTLTYTTDDPGGICGSVSASMILTINSLPFISDHPINIITCEGGNATFSVTASGAGLSYQWRKGTTNLSNGGSISGTNSATLVITGVISNDAAADYNCVISGTCPPSVISTDAALVVNTLPTISSLGNISANTAGGCSVNITHAELLAQISATGVPTPDITFAPAAGEFNVGTTIVTATAENSCSSASTTFNIIITDNENPVLSACPTNMELDNEPGNCFAHATWSIPSATDNCTATVVCNPASGSSFNIGTTTVICIASDPSNNTNSCSFTVTVTDAEYPVINNCPLNIIQCNDPVAIFDLPTATDNCSALVVCDPESGSSFETGTTMVTCTATDPSGLFSSCSFLVTIHESPAFIGASITDNQCFGDNEGEIDVTDNVDMGTLPYSYVWSTNETTPIISNLPGGTYTVTVTDAEGCSATLALDVYEPDPITVTSTQSNVSCFGGLNGAIDLTVNGGTPPYTFDWTNSEITEDLSNLSAGAYDVFISDALFCPQSASLTIAEPELLVATETHTHVLCNGGLTGTATIAATGGTAPYSGTGLKTGLAAGTYSYVVTDANGCSSSVSVTIEEPSVLIASEIHTDVLCNGGSTGTAIISATGGSAPYNGSGLITDLAAGTYSYIVTDANGCNAFTDVTIEEPLPLMASEIHTDVLCHGELTGTVTISADGGTAPYNGTGLITDLAAGTYSYVITDANGCTASIGVSIEEPELLEATCGSSDVTCNGGNDGVVNVTANGGTIPYFYLWNDNSTSDMLTNLIPGTFTVTVTDGNGCSAICESIISEPAPLTASATADNQVGCFSGNNGQATVIANDGTLPYSYFWSDAQETATATGLIAGTYTVVVTDNCGATVETSIEITEPLDPVSIQAQLTYLQCHGDADGEIDLEISGGTGPYEFLWSNLSTDEDLTGLVAGTYIITVTDANGCVYAESMDITEPDLLVVTGLTTSANCFGSNTGAIDIAVSGGTPDYTFEWSNSSFDEDISDLAAGVYTVIVTDEFNCSVNAEFTVAEPALLVASEIHTNALCNGGSSGTVSISATGGTSPYSGTGIFTALEAGTYFYTVTDANGCSSSVSVTIEEPALLVASETHTDVLINGGSSGTATISATGGTAPYSGTGLITGLAAGTYSYTVTDANGCSSSVSVTISEPSVLIASEMHTDVLCNGGSTGTATISATGGVPPYSGTGVITDLAAGTYSYNVTDANGSTSSVSVTIAEPEVLVASEVHTNVLCNGGLNGTATISATGGKAPYSGTGVIIDLAAGTYSYTITDANGCSSSVSVIIVEPPVLVASEVHTDALCNGSSTGTAIINATGGTAPYTGTGLLTDLAAGIHSYTVTDANGCSSSVSVTIEEPVLLSATASVDTHVSCFEGNNGQATVIVNDGTLPYSYLWSDAQETATATGLVAGIYTVVVTDNCGATVETSIEITEPLDPVSIQAQLTYLQCHGDADGEIDLEISGGTGPYEFLWSNLSTDEDLTGLVAGTYIVTVTDANGCVYAESMDITEPDLLVVTGLTTSANCFGSNTGAIDIAVSGGTPDYTFEWSNSSFDEDISDLAAGVYTVIVTDEFNCSVNAEFTVAEPALLVASEIHTGVLCNGGTTGTVSISATGGTAPYSGTDVITDLAAGSYSFTVTDANGCTSSISIIIEEPALLTASASHTGVLCNGTSTGTATISATGGTAPYSGTGLITGLAAGTYSYTVTDANGCSSSVSVTIEEPALLVASETHTDVLINGGSSGTATISATGGTAPYSGTGLITGLAAGTYSYTVTDANGCSSSVSVTISEPSVLTASETHTDVLCNGDATGTATISATGGVPPYSGTGVITDLAAGTYSYNVTDANGSTSSVSVTIAEPEVLVASEVHTNVLCNGGLNGTATISATGGKAPYSGTGVIIDLAAGTYSYTITDANGCSSSVSVIIVEPPVLVASEVHTDALCNGSSTGTATISATGGAAPYSGTGFIENLAAGTYSYTVTDANGCSSSVSVTIEEPVLLSATASVDTHVSCFEGNNGQATVIVNDGTLPYSYLWSDAQETATATGLVAGTYTVVVTDNCGATVEAFVEITEPLDPVLIQAQVTDVQCHGDADGEINLDIYGGTAPYSLLWSDLSTDEEITGLIAGSYMVTITDANGCVYTESIAVTEPDLLVVNGVTTHAACFGSNTGAIDIAVSGGTPDYTFEWSNSSFDEDISDLAAGVYTVIVTDEFNCSVNAEFTVAEPAMLIASEIHTGVLCNGGTTGTATISATGGTAPYSGTGVITDLAAGPYSFTVTDANGCSSSVSVTIEEPAVLVASEVHTDVLCYGGSTGTATISVTGGTAPYSGSGLISDLAAGTHSYTVADANGCSSSVSVTIEEPALLVASETHTDVLINGGSSGTATISATGGTPPYSGTGLITGLASGTYSYTVTDANGCSSSVSVTISEPSVLTASETHTDVLCNGDATGTATISATGGVPPYSGTGVITDLAAGTYSYNVTDANGSTSSVSVTIAEPEVLVASEVHTNVLCNGGLNGTATISATGGKAPYSGTGVIIDLAAGTYSYTITDANGCSSSVSVIIVEPPVLVASEVHTDALCNGSSTGTATISATGGAAPYSGTGFIENLAAGTYSYTVTDANGCSSSVSVTIEEPVLLSATASVDTHVSCFEGNNGQATVIANDGTLPYSYLWSDAQETATATGLVAGTYTVVVTDNCGATVETFVEITEPLDPVLIQAQVTDVQCHGDADGEINLDIYGGTAPYSLLWSDLSTDEEITGLIAGSYTVTITDANGCVYTESIAVTEPDLLVVNGVTTHAACFGSNTGAIDITVSGGTPDYTFEWSNSSFDEDISDLAAGVYTVIVTDEFNCSVNAEFTVAEPAMLIASEIHTGVLCNGGTTGTATISATGGTAPYSGTGVITDLAAGPYSFTVTDANGCSSSVSVTIEEPAVLVASEVHTDVLCYGGSTGTATISVTGGTAPYSGSGLISDLAAGTYTYTVTDANGCSSSVSVTIEEPALLVASAVHTNVLCNGGSSGTATISATGGTPPYSGTGLITGLASGTYSYTVTDANGCSSSVSVTIAEPTVIIVSTTSGYLGCAGINGWINTNVTGGIEPYNYLWSTSATTASVNGLTAGVYTVSVSDTYGCITIKQETILPYISVAANATVTNIVCRGINTGSIVLNPSGGNAPYTFLWNNGATVQNRTALAAGTYTVTVKDANLCTNVQSYTITTPSSTMLINYSKTNIRCEGLLSGIATASPVGGTAPYSFSWNTFPVQTTATISGLAAGVYTCVVTDFIGCTKTIVVDITEPPAIVVVPTQTNVTFPGGNNGSASIAVSGGTPGYTYSWNTIPVKTTASITGLTAGVYKCTVMDSKSCPVKLSFTITEPISKPETNGYNYKKWNLVIYPNPSNGMIHAKIDGLDNNEAIEFCLTDIAGRVVYRNQINWLPEDERLFDFTGLAKGVYTITCKSQSTHLIHKIVIE